MDGKKATIALLDLNNKQIVTVDYNRDQGFLTGMGIDVKDKAKNGDEDKTGKYTGGKGGDYEIVCNEPTLGAADTGKTAMENCLSKNKSINLVYTINEPSAGGAAEALRDAGVKATIVSVDGGCDPGLKLVKDGTIGATSQQYPVKMAELGVEAIKTIAEGGEKPANTPGKEFYDTGVALVTDEKAEGVDSISVAEGEKLCWGK
jgi:fructose transport system substrate-binding protein